MLQIDTTQVILENFISSTLQSTTQSDMHFFSLKREQFKAIILKEILRQYPFTAVDLKSPYIP